MQQSTTRIIFYFQKNDNISHNLSCYYKNIVALFFFSFSWFFFLSHRNFLLLTTQSTLVQYATRNHAAKKIENPIIFKDDASQEQILHHCNIKYQYINRSTLNLI